MKQTNNSTHGTKVATKNKFSNPVKDNEVAETIKQLQIQLPHYCTHAAQYFQEVALQKASNGLDNNYELFLAQYLQESIKFFLPDNGHLFSDHDYKPSMFELQKLPFPACALEFAAGDELYVKESGMFQSTKRIALCFDPHQLPEIQRTRLAHLLDEKTLLVPCNIYNCG